MFRSAVTGVDGEVDAGYLAMFYGIVVVTMAIPVMVVGALVQMFITPAHLFPVQDLGIGIGAVCGGFATLCAAIGAFRMGDKPHGPPAVTSTPATTVTVNQ